MDYFELLPELYRLSLNGVPVALITLLVVQTAKGVGLVRTERAAQVWNVGVALLFGGVWLTREFRPQWAPIIDTCLVALVGSLASALLYQAADGIVKKVSGGTRKLGAPDTTLEQLLRD